MPRMGVNEKFEKLETIVSELENSEIDIDRALKLYKDGVSIICELSTKLKDVSKEINILKEKLDGTFDLDSFEDFEGDEDEHDE